MAHIETISEDAAQGKLKEIYTGLLKSRGKIADVHKIQSLNLQSITDHMNLYMTIMFGQSPIKRVHRELMAVVVSKANGCEYCQVHHAEAIQHYWKDQAKVDQLKTDFRQVDLSEEEIALCAYAQELTLHPEKANDSIMIQGLKNAGFSDRAILDATLVISYFNFVNRIVQALGVELEEDPGGYKYE